jgi:hypothetical protein
MKRNAMHVVRNAGMFGVPYRKSSVPSRGPDVTRRDRRDGRFAYRMEWRSRDCGFHKSILGVRSDLLPRT